MLKLYSIYIDRFSNNGHNKISSGSGDTDIICRLWMNPHKEAEVQNHFESA